ncbi:MAG: hypothetical protein COA78_35280 [Blastopirellula sp.]|nr:MAG: hypothetical protein COA78_35280 [Blastopirellula sp.]
MTFWVANALTSGNTADDSGVDYTSGSTVFGTSSVWPQAIRGYRGQEYGIHLVRDLLYTIRLIALHTGEASGTQD